MGNIKGITIEIGGDTTKLDKAISAISKNANSLQSELKQVEKLLKLDPTNTELLAQKQKLLKDSISETSKKLDVLKEAESQVQEQFAKGEVSEEQYRALQREIVKTEIELSNYKTTLNSTTNEVKELQKGTKLTSEEFKKAKEQASGLNESLENLETTALGATAALAATTGVATASFISTATEFDKASNQLMSKTGVATENAAEYDAVMQSIYGNNYGESIGDVGEALGEVMNQSWNWDTDNLENVTTKAIVLRDTFGYDVNESIRSVNMLMGQFGISADEAFNLVTQGAQNGLDKNGDLLDSINEYSVHYSQMGVDAEGFFNSLINGSSSGTFSVDKLGDAYKEFGIRVKDTSTTTDEGYQLLGLNADAMREKFAAGGESAETATTEVLNALFSMDDQVKQNQAGVDLFGTMWEDLGKEGVKALTDVTNETDAIDLTRDALEKINEIKYNDLSSQFGEVKRSLQTEVINPIGEELTPAISEVISVVKEKMPEVKELIWGIVDKVREFISFMLQNGPTIVSVIVGIAAGMKAWNVVTMIQGVIAAIKVWKATTEGLSISQKILNVVMSANPIGIIITIIVSLIVALITLFATNEEFRTKVIAVWEVVRDTAMSIFGAIAAFFTETIPNAISSFITFMQTSFEGIKNTISLFILNIKTFFEGIPVSIKQVFAAIPIFFGTLFQNAWTNVKGAFANVGTFFLGLWDTIVGTFTNIGTKIGDAVGGAFKGAVNGVFQTVENIVNGFIDIINGALGIINNIPGVDIGTIGAVSLPRLAKGGVLQNGQAIMAEAGPELISMVNGKAVVTPLTRSAKNTAVGNAGTNGNGGFTQNIYNTSPKALSPAETARQTRNATQQMILKLRRV